jgi:hypothetical protein
MRKMRGVASLTTLASAHRQSLLLQIARVAVLALASSTDLPRVRLRFEACSMLCSKLSLTMGALAWMSNPILRYVLTWR